MKPGQILMPFALSALLAQEPGDPISRDALRAHIAFLADDLLEGRGLGQRGGELAVRYLEAQLRALGLQPANRGSFLQPVAMSGILPDPVHTRMAIASPAGRVDIRIGKDYFLVPTVPLPQVALDAPLVFVGHGIETHGRNDYKGQDVRGKVVVMLVGERADTNTDAPCCTPAHYFGRWTYKIEEAARHGAAGLIMVHTPRSAGYDWSVTTTGYTRERFAPRESGTPQLLLGFMTEDASRRLLAAAGQDLATLTRRADSPGFRPVELGLRATGQVASRIRELVQHNVAGILPGTDPVLKDEMVVYAAHWDHFGKAEDGRTFNGAVDNASGCASVLAIAQAAARHPARRSQLFLFPTAEEFGLLGSQAYVRSPLHPLDRTVAMLNLESLNVLGPTRDMAALGADASELGEHANRVAAAMGMRFRGTAPDPQSLFFRCDAFSFALAGVPAISPGFSLDGGWDYVQDRTGSQARAEAWLKDGYHQPTDRYDPAWTLEGTQQHTRFVYELGQAVANAPRAVRWLKGRPDFGHKP